MEDKTVLSIGETLLISFVKTFNNKYQNQYQKKYNFVSIKNLCNDLYDVGFKYGENISNGEELYEKIKNYFTYFTKCDF